MSRRHLVIFLLLLLGAIFGVGLAIKRLMERYGAGHRRKRKRQPAPAGNPPRR